jgi:RNA polymerase-binding transcription factor DksA
MDRAGRGREQKMDSAHLQIRQQLEAQLDRVVQRGGRLEVNAIRFALDRLENGTYTECAKCGRAIDPRRLHALPTTTTCLPCSI